MASSRKENVNNWKVISNSPSLWNMSDSTRYKLMFLIRLFSECCSKDVSVKHLVCAVEMFFNLSIIVKMRQRNETSLTLQRVLHAQQSVKVERMQKWKFLSELRWFPVSSDCCKKAHSCEVWLKISRFMPGSQKSLNIFFLKANVPCFSAWFIVSHGLGYQAELSN